LEGSPPQGPSRATAGQVRFPGKQGIEAAAGAPRRGRRGLSFLGVWGSQPPSVIPEGHFSWEILFSGDDYHPAPALPPQGMLRVFTRSRRRTHAFFDYGAHCDAPVLPEREIFRQLRTGNTAQSQQGDAIAAGAWVHDTRSVRIIQRISPQPDFPFGVRRWRTRPGRYTVFLSSGGMYVNPVSAFFTIPIAGK